LFLTIYKTIVASIHLHTHGLPFLAQAQVRKELPTLNFVDSGEIMAASSRDSERSGKRFPSETWHRNRIQHTTYYEDRCNTISVTPLAVPRNA